MRLFLAPLLALAALLPASAQTPSVKTWVAAHQPEIMQEYLQLVAIPNFRGDLPNIRRNADFLQKMLTRHGLAAQVWDTPSTPMVYGEHLVPGASTTVLFYIHYDGQPVEPKTWAQPDPWTPVLRDAPLDEGGKIVDPATLKTFPPNFRLYARAAADDKGPIEALCAAMDAIAQHPAINVKVILHGEEEGGGPALDFMLAHHAADLKADLMILLDGPQHPSGRQTIYYGARGGAGLDLTVYTAKSAMHSGNYGNWLPDANMRLAQLLSSMVLPSGRVAIEGFYADLPPFTPAELAMFKAAPDDSAAMQRRFGVGSLDGAASSLQEGLNIPAFSIHTLQGGEVGGVIAGHASAQIALRLVAENDPNTMVQRVIAHIRKQGYFIVDKDPDTATLAAHERIAKVTFRANPEKGGGAWRTDPNLPIARFLHEAITSAWGPNLVEFRTAGGGVPAGPFIEVNHVPVIGVALVNYDDNQHTDNENMRLGNLWDGIETLAAILQHPATAK